MALGVQLDGSGRVVLDASGRVILANAGAPCCCGDGGGGACVCFSRQFRDCPGDNQTFCCSARQFDVITTIRARTTTTVDVGAWGLPLFGYEPVPDAPEDGVLLDGLIEYTNTLSVRCVDGRQTVRQVGQIRWGVEYYTLLGPPGASFVDNVAINGENTWDVPPANSQAAIVPVEYGHAVDFNPLFFPASVSGVDRQALDAILPPLVATQFFCVETYTPGSLLTTASPYVYVPINFAPGGTQVIGNGTTSASCAFRTSSMRFQWSFLGGDGNTYGSSTQEWDMSDQTIAYDDCDPDPCDPLEGL